MDMPKVLYFVVPCYNDEDTLPASIPVFLKKLEDLIGAGTVSPKSRLLLINDGSADRTWDCIVQWQREYPHRITGLDLAGNFGEQNALIAGMTFASDKADCVITMDSDLQDDINAVDPMLTLFYAGKDIVYGVRNDRSSDGLAERICSMLFYRMMKAAKTGQIAEHANYRLMSTKAIRLLLEDLPVNYYLPCVVSGMGLSGATVPYQRFARISGVSGYSISKKVCLAKDAVFSHSAFPLKLISLGGALGLLAAVVCFFVFLFAEKTAPFVWLLPLSVVCLFGAACLFALRIVGEYACKAFEEAKKPKKFQIESVAEDRSGE